MEKNFVGLVREKFAFLEMPRNQKNRDVSGFFEYLAQEDADWESYCGYWTVFFVLTFNWDQRESLLMLSLRRNYSIFSPCYKDADVVSLSKIIKLVEPDWVDSSRERAATIEDVARIFDVYADALRKHYAPILSPPADKRYHYYDLAKSSVG